jgi:hypothetical protein
MKTRRRSRRRSPISSLLLPGGRHHFLGGVCEPRRCDNGATALLEQFSACVNVRALQAHDQGNAEIELVIGGQECAGDRVAPHDAAEDIHEHGFHVGCAQKDTKPFEDLVFIGATAHVQKVGRFSAMVFDQVHRAHRQARAVDEAGDVAVEAHIREAALGRPELRAGKSGLSYVSLDGNIACLVNGAGLAMSSMVLIKYLGGEPAIFLDVGGGASKDQVLEGFRILLGSPTLEAVLVNIFGGIMKCDTIAAAILAAYDEIDFRVPLVVRLEGTNVEAGRRLLETSGRKIITASGLTDAAQKVVAAARGAA